MKKYIQSLHYQFLSSFSVGVWIFSPVFRVSRFSAKYRKKIYWSKICITSKW